MFGPGSALVASATTLYNYLFPSRARFPPPQPLPFQELCEAMELEYSQLVATASYDAKTSHQQEKGKRTGVN